MCDSVTIGLEGPLTAVIQLSQNLGENEIQRWFYISFFFLVQSHTDSLDGAHAARGF